MAFRFCWVTLLTQGCNSIVISWLFGHVGTTLQQGLIMPSSLLQVVNSLFQICWQLGTSSANTTCWRSSVTEEHGALRHILWRGPSATSPPPPSPKQFSVSVPFWESKNFSAHTPIFPKHEKNFPEKPKNFPDILYFSPKLKHFDNISKSLSEIPDKIKCQLPLFDVYCHCRCIFIVIPYNRINLNHNLNLVGALRGPLTVGGP
jgi:hypothetical protein